jgi:MFS family permease
MSSQLAVLRYPGFARVISSQLLARFPFGMMSLGLVMHIEDMHDSYAVAGIALGAETIGAAISGPVLARWLSRFGTRPVILSSALIGAAALLILGTFWLTEIAVVLLALAVGLTSPPIQSAVRTIYPTLVKKKDLNTVYSLDATAQEIIWVIGPVAAALLAAGANTGFVVILMAITQVIGSLLFCANREVGQLRIDLPKGKVGSVLKNKLVFANAVVGLLMVGSFSGVEVGAVAILDKALAGLVLAALSVGSIVGGLLLGHRGKTKWALTKFLSIIAFGYAAVWLAPENAFWIGACFFVAGLGVAPAFGYLAAMIASSLKQSESAEAYGWINTGQLMGYSAGAALSGIAIDLISNVAAIWVSIVFAAATVLAAIMTSNLTPQSMIATKGK